MLWRYWRKINLLRKICWSKLKVFKIIISLHFLFIAERDILEKIKNPYIVGLHYAFQTETKLYFLIDFLNGGELFTYLRKEGRFNEERAKLYTAEMIVAIGFLH